MGRYLDLVRKFEAQRAALAGGTVEMPRSAPVAAPSRRIPATIYDELVNATPPSPALEAFHDWGALLVKSEALGMTLWVVRDEVYGIALARETGLPALKLDAILVQKGRTQDEVRAALLPVLIAAEQ